MSSWLIPFVSSITPHTWWFSMLFPASLLCMTCLLAIVTKQIIFREFFPFNLPNLYTIHGITHVSAINYQCSRSFRIFGASSITVLFPSSTLITENTSLSEGRDSFPSIWTRIWSNYMLSPARNSKILFLST